MMDTFWTRRGLNYVARLNCYHNSERWIVTKKLFFISYWGIYWIHGPMKLREMATKHSHPEDWAL